MSGRRNFKTLLVMTVILLGFGCTIAAGGTIYVDASASGSNDGSSWADAYNNLQDALAVAQDGNDIWVAEDTYKPAGPGGSRTATFQLISGVEIYGGFAGGESTLGERDWQTNETILSGDLNGNDVGFTNNGENSYHVVTGSWTEPNAVLDGFTITGGNANGSAPDNWGGGMYNFNFGSSPTVTNCTFSGNSAGDVGDGGGGGMYNFFKSNPTVTNCTFSGNSVDFPNTGGGMYNEDSSPTVTSCTFSGNSAGSGGGMYNRNSSRPTVTDCNFSGNSGSGMSNKANSNPTVTNCMFSGNLGSGMSNTTNSSPTVTNCTFSGNSTAAVGGGMCNGSSSSPTVTNCTFSGNSAGNVGGGMYNNNSDPTVTNCLFSGNWAFNDGGGMSNDDSSPTVTNCTFSENSAEWGDGGGLYRGSPTVNNCILWGNTDSGPTDESAQIFQIFLDGPAVNYSCVQGWTGGLGGTGNIGDDPNFVDPNGPDDIIGTEDDNLRLSADSNCIDAGDNTAVPPDTADLDGDVDTAERTPLDLDGQDRFIDDPNTPDTGVILPASYPENVDMGAYEFYGGPACGDAEHPYPPGDVSGPDGVQDCYLDFYDFAVWALHWLEYTGPE